MGRNKPRSVKKTNVNEAVLFDVIYEDGSRSSNRRVLTADLEGGDELAAAKANIESQDRVIAEKSGRPRGPIKQVMRSGG